jgi:hypothetical protein
LVNFESLKRHEYVNARVVRVCACHRALPGSEITYLFHCAHHRRHCSHAQTDRFYMDTDRRRSDSNTH